MLRRTAVGINVDRDYLDVYSEQVSRERAQAEAELAVHELIGGTGKAKHLLEHLDSIGELPLTGRVPRTGLCEPPRMTSNFWLIRWLKLSGH